MHVVIVVPCYNEAHRLPVEAFRDFTLSGGKVEFLFVNDGSSDGTLSLLERLHSADPVKFGVLNLDRNIGKAEAVRRGILEALNRNPEIVGFWDADLATPLSELPRLLEVFAVRPRVEMVFASRVRLLGRSIIRHAYRHYLGRISATLIAETLGVAIYDTQCGAKLFRASVPIRGLFVQPFVARWIFDAEIIARFIFRCGRQAALNGIYELPLDMWTDVTGSNISAASYLKSLRDLWKIHRTYHPRR